MDVWMILGNVVELVTVFYAFILVGSCAIVIFPSLTFLLCISPTPSCAIFAAEGLHGFFYVILRLLKFPSRYSFII